jgi:hypothetical protein
MARPQVGDGEDDIQIWKAAAKILNEQWRTADKGWSCSFGLGETLTTHLEKYHVTKHFTKPLTWTTVFWWEDQKGKHNIPRPGPRREDNIKTDFKISVGRAWIGLMWFRIQTSGGML